ncbi:hypothetical protein Tco_0233288 [Tanacetum coccineum]
MEPDNENMTLNEYLEYKAEKERLFWKSVAPVRNRVLVYRDPDEEDKEMKKNIDISIVMEKEEVPVDDVEMGKDHDVD